MDDWWFPIEGADYFIYYLKLPPKVYAFIMGNSDGTYTMFLDPRRDFLSQINDWEHEVWHILRDDMTNGKPIWIVEKTA